MIWKENYTVNAHDIDMTGKMRVSAMMRYMQETAYRHMSGTGPSEAELRADGRAFMLSRIAMKIYAAPGHGDGFSVETFAEESRGISFGRTFFIRLGDSCAVEAKSVWVLYDLNEKRLLHIGDIEHRYGEEPPFSMDLPRRISVPDGAEMLNAGEHEVEYADVDVNGHMNNTVYADIVCGRVPEIRAGGARASYVYINYSNECRLGDKIKIERCRAAEGDWLFRTHRDDGRLNIEARIMTV